MRYSSLEAMPKVFMELAQPDMLCVELRPTLGEPMKLFGVQCVHPSDIAIEWANGRSMASRAAGNVSATPERRAEILENLEDLRGKVLGCWCEEPLPCHGRVLIKLLDEKTAQ